MSEGAPQDPDLHRSHKRFAAILVKLSWSSFYHCRFTDNATYAHRDLYTISPIMAAPAKK